MEITWEEPIFSDNSFAAVHITKSHKPGVFPLGTTQVTYVAYDKDNNTAKCVIEITVQGILLFDNINIIMNNIHDYDMLFGLLTVYKCDRKLN